MSARSDRGEAQATAQGLATIRATWNGKQLTRELQVWPAARAGLEVRLQAPVVFPGEVTEVQLVERLTDGSVVDLTSDAGFSTSNEAVARIELLGRRAFVRAFSTGQAAVMVSFAGLRAVLSVSEQPAVGLEFDVEQLEVPVGLA
ncbi:MAG: hypothetical protein AB1730_08065 [Myxococcota bacterium]